MDSTPQYQMTKRDIKASENADPLTLEIARIIDPVNFLVTPVTYGLDEKGFKKTFAYMGQLVAIKKAIEVIARVREADLG